MKVEVNATSGETTLKKLFSKVIIQKSDIAGYYTTLYKGSRAKSWRGLLLITTNNKSIRLTEQNLKSLEELRKFFEQEKLNYLGEKRPFFLQ